MWRQRLVCTLSGRFANVPCYYPKLNIGGSSFGGPGFFWDQRPSAEAISAQVAQTKGSHYLTSGLDYRRGGGAGLCQQHE